MSAKPFRIQGAQTLASAPVAQVDRSTAVVDQLQGAAADIRREGEKLEAHRLKRTEEKERFGSLVGLQSLNKELAVEDQTRLDAMEPGAENYASDSMKFYETAEEKYLATVPQSQQQNIQIRLGSLRAKYQNGVSSTERDERTRFQFQTVKGSLNSYELQLRSNPGSFSEVSAEALDLIDATSIPLKLKARLRDASRKQFGLTWADGLSARQKVAWFKSGGEVPSQFSENVSGLDAGDFAKIERAGDTELRVAAAELRPQIKDHFASLEATGVGLPGMDGQAEGVLSGEDLASYREGVQDATASYEAFETIKMAPPSEIVDVLRANKPVPGAEGFANDERRSASLNRAAQKIITARERDPAGSVSSFPAVKELVDANAPPQEIVAARIAAQEAIGIPRSLQAAIPKAHAKGIVTSIASTPAVERAQRLKGLFDEFGSAAPKVFGSLVEAGLDPQTQILATLADDAAGSQILANAIDIGAKELKAGLESEVVKDIKVEIQTKLLEFSQAFSARDFTGQAVKKLNSLQSTVELMALNHARGGMDADDAAEAAYKSIVGDRYEVVDSGEMHGFIPKENGEPVVSENRLSQAVGKALGREALEAFAPAPFTRRGANSPATLIDKEATVSAAENSGYFVTNRDGTGVILVVPFNGGGVLPLLNEQGENYELLFRDVAEDQEFDFKVRTPEAL